ncbi:hypothetical protein GOP47_0022620 [Adiantum capillus-veneris]|uniref:Uncharacterized protein n=1 Tax=Adiantum capillus-veneris TaxID=13818 RepID=A0A9D4Z708_ADICA|nr:hypothetical protein GOP47_0022620 [Adiantum capillus-veneris]
MPRRQLITLGGLVSIVAVPLEVYGACPTFSNLVRQLLMVAGLISIVTAPGEVYGACPTFRGLISLSDVVSIVVGVGSALACC